MVRAKAGTTVSVCLPARNEEATIGPIVASSFRAGRHTETVVPALARTMERRFGADRMVEKE